MYDKCELPYFDLVPLDPSLDEMKKCVVTDGLRPAVSSRWTSCAVLQGMTRIMRECWAANSAARLTALRVRKSIDTLSELVKEAKV
ncbi:unnamed protein product [Soboliphyme baturini]|uniref:PK_Tyr_Ser-Thr domain-containing protein n=1 Tax=Soboliphyme baturini TaxID=241478 RepID=A0A183J0K8_9BILA|nr:unnamed protein product [Soboliphyme baturini]